MKSLKVWVLRHALMRPCEATIVRMGEGVDEVNCFVVAVDRNDEAYLVVLSMSGEVLNCLEHDGHRYAIDRQLRIEHFSSSDFRVTHFYGPDSVIYSGLIDFAFGWVTRLPYIKIWLHRRIERIDQYFFNKRKLITKQRTELLKFMVSQALSGKNEFESLDLMIDLYSIRWIAHPDADSERDKLKFYLNSLADTGELKYQNHKYYLTGLALKAIEAAEEQDQKHVENVKLQRGMVWLTLVITLLTMAQAGLIKLPTIIDLSAIVQ